MIESLEMMSPQQFKTYVKSVEVVYGFHASPWGEALILATPKGLCGLAFATPENRKACFDSMTKNYARYACFKESVAQTRPFIEAALALKPVSLTLHGTPFQLKVWRALLDVPRGSAASYEDVARKIGTPQSYRAVANAIGANPVSYIVPCHRIVRKTGALGGYRWGPALKRRLLAHEGGSVKLDPAGEYLRPTNPQFETRGV